MAVIGSLAVSVSAHTIGLTRGLGTAARSVTGFGGKLLGLATRLGPLAAGITGVAGAAGLGLLVKNSFETVDALAKTSDKLGIGTEALAGLQHAAGLSGVGTESLNNSLQRMTRGVSEAAKEATGPASDALNELGLSAERLVNLSPDQQFLAITEALGGIENQSDKVRLAFDIFGRSGVDTLNLMKGGVDGLRDTMQEAQDLGLGVSREDAAQIEAANDAITRVKGAFKGVANTIAVAVAPMLEGIAVRVVNFGKLARSAFVSVTPIVRQVGNVVSAAWNLIGTGASAVFGFIGSAAGSTFSGVGDFILDTLVMGEFLFANFGDVASVAWDAVKLGALSAFNDIAFFFTDQAPALLDWFSRNWREVWFDALNMTATVIENLAANVGSGMRAIWDFIASGGTEELAFAWTPLTEGFISTLEELPPILTREMSAAEKALAGSIDRQQSDLSGRLGAFLAQRRKELLGDGEAFDVKGGLSFDLPDEIDSVAAKAPDAIDFGLTQAQKQAIQLQARGAGATPEQKSAKELASANAKLTEQNKLLTDMLAAMKEQVGLARGAPRPATIG